MGLVMLVKGEELPASGSYPIMQGRQAQYLHRDKVDPTFEKISIKCSRNSQTSVRDNLEHTFQFFSNVCMPERPVRARLAFDRNTLFFFHKGVMLVYILRGNSRR
jgi:hypothetical protein